MHIGRRSRDVNVPLLANCGIERTNEMSHAGEKAKWGKLITANGDVFHGTNQRQEVRSADGDVNGLASNSNAKIDRMDSDDAGTASIDSHSSVSSHDEVKHGGDIEISDNGGVEIVSRGLSRLPLRFASGINHKRNKCSLKPRQEDAQEEDCKESAEGAYFDDQSLMVASVERISVSEPSIQRPKDAKKLREVVVRVMHDTTHGTSLGDRDEGKADAQSPETRSAEDFPQWENSTANTKLATGAKNDEVGLNPGRNIPPNEEDNREEEHVSPCNRENDRPPNSTQVSTKFNKALLRASLLKPLANKSFRPNLTREKSSKQEEENREEEDVGPYNRGNNHPPSATLGSAKLRTSLLKSARLVSLAKKSLHPTSTRDNPLEEGRAIREEEHVSQPIGKKDRPQSATQGRATLKKYLFTPLAKRSTSRETQESRKMLTEDQESESDNLAVSLSSRSNVESNFSLHAESSEGDYTTDGESRRSDFDAVQELFDALSETGVGVYGVLTDIGLGKRKGADDADVKTEEETNPAAKEAGNLASTEEAKEGKECVDTDSDKAKSSTSSSKKDQSTSICVPNEVRVKIIPSRLRRKSPWYIKQIQREKAGTTKEMSKVTSLTKRTGCVEPSDPSDKDMDESRSGADDSEEVIFEEEDLEDIVSRIASDVSTITQELFAPKDNAKEALKSSNIFVQLKGNVCDGVQSCGDESEALYACIVERVTEKTKETFTFLCTDAPCRDFDSSGSKTIRHANSDIGKGDDYADTDDAIDNADGDFADKGNVAVNEDHSITEQDMAEIASIISVD